MTTERNIKDEIIQYFRYYVTGYKQARPRHLISSALGIDDRVFREVCADIPEIISSCEIGYWMLPARDITGEEAEQARKALNQERAKYISMYYRTRKKRRAVDEMANLDKQKELF